MTGDAAPPPKKHHCPTERSEHGALKGHHCGLNGSEILRHAGSIGEKKSDVGDLGDHISIPPAPYPKHHHAATSHREKVNVPTKGDLPVFGDTKPYNPKGGPTQTVEKTVVDPGAEKANPGEKPAISVQFSDQSGPKEKADPKAKPDPEAKPNYTFRVDDKGQVLDSEGKQVSKDIDFSRGVPKDIVIQVDKAARPADFDKLSDPEKVKIKDQEKAQQEKQQAALNDFVQGSLKTSLAQSSPLLLQDGMKVQDDTKLVNPQTQEAVGPGKLQPFAKPTPAEAPPEPLPPPPADAPKAPQGFSSGERHSAHRMNGRHGMRDNDHGSMSPERAREFFPEGTPKQANEDTQSFARRETMAAMFNPDKADPYGTLRHREDGSYAVGRYGHSFNHFNNVMHNVLHHVKWPPSVMAQLGDPPDWSKLDQILKDNPDLLKNADIQKQLADGVQEEQKNGNLPQSMAGNFKDLESVGKFAGFVDKLKGKSGEITKDELKQFAPKEVQDAMAEKSVSRGLKVGATPGQMALAQHLGIEADQLTDDQKKDPKNQEFMKAADKYYALATARQDVQPGQNIEWDTSIDKDNPQAAAVRMRIAQTAGSHYTGGYGWCARSCQQDLAAADPHLRKYLGSGNAWDMGQNMLRGGEWVQVDPRQAKAGDAIFFHDPSYLGDVQLIKGVDRNGNYHAYNDNEYYDNVSSLGNVRHIRNARKGLYYDRSIVLRYVGDRQMQASAQRPPEQSADG